MGDSHADIFYEKMAYRYRGADPLEVRKIFFNQQFMLLQVNHSLLVG
jgi:hypothetical protein